MNLSSILTGGLFEAALGAGIALVSCLIGAVLYLRRV